MRKRWNAEDVGCGQLAVELRRRMEGLAPGDRLEVAVADAGAAADVAAWCRMTGHVLVDGEPPVLLLERRGPGVP